MKRLLERREHLVAQIKELSTRLAELDLNLALLRGEGEEGTPVPAPPTKRRKNVKKTVMGLIDKAADLGVTADEIVEQGGAMGQRLDRRSVSSLLSKLKSDGVLRFDGERYYQTPRTPSQNPPTSFKILRMKE